MTSNNTFGLLLLDKPTGFSSFRAMHHIKKQFNLTKTGHTGTLDPLATGMLPLCLGEAVKFSQYLLDSDKSYRALAKLGEKTNTGDKEGEILERRTIPAFSVSDIERILDQFRGTILQVPPMYSAIKYEGKRLYRWARKGYVIERPAREVQIHQLTLVAHTEDTLTLDIVCSKGTYIRTLIEDIGELLGAGAHIQALHRHYVKPFDTQKMYSLSHYKSLAPDELNAYILPMSVALSHIPVLHLGKEDAHALSQGKKRVHSEKNISGEPVVHQLVNEETQLFIGIGTLSSDHIVSPKRMLTPQESIT